jgi:hypothetical protein
MTLEERRTHNRLYMRQWRAANPSLASELLARSEALRRRNLRQCFGCRKYRRLQNLQIVERLVAIPEGFTTARFFWCGRC